MSTVIDEHFFVPRPPIGLIVLPNAAMEAYALRGLLEALGGSVLTHWVGTPSDFLKILGQGAAAPRYLVIAAHGDEAGNYYMGEYADPIDTRMLRNQHLPPEAIAPIVDLPGRVILSTACGSGQTRMAQAFFASGTLAAYMGCRISPNAPAMAVWVANFFFGVLGKGLTDYEAWRKAVEATDHPDTDQISYYWPVGIEERCPEHYRDQRPGRED